MFSFLKELDHRLFERYRTLERNIKSASNSFYDAYLDLQEQFLRIVLENEGVETSSGNSAGSILKNPACQNLLISVIGVDQHTFDKMGDYALKVNAHKHKKKSASRLTQFSNILRSYMTPCLLMQNSKVLNVRLLKYPPMPKCLVCLREKMQPCAPNVINSVKSFPPLSKKENSKIVI